MKRSEIPCPCNSCSNMKAWSLYMDGNHDYTCTKKPSSMWGNPNCNKFNNKFESAVIKEDEE